MNVQAGWNAKNDILLTGNVALYDSSGDSHDLNVWRNVLGNESSGPDNAVIANLDVVDDDRADTHVRCRTEVAVSRDVGARHDTRIILDHGVVTDQGAPIDKNMPAYAGPGRNYYSCTHDRSFAE
jgi:hypothetical protein